jgi:ABC-2 type transport system ATP-binding protein
MLSLKNFKKHYNNQPILEIPEMNIPSGIHWIKGINGSGKTTFFKCISGILYSEGEIEIEGTNLKKDPVPYRRLVNYSEAEPLYPAVLSGNDLIQFTAKARKADNLQVESLIAALDISAFIFHPVGSYSSGMLKKLSLVMGFIGRPKLIILDEPLVTIDTIAVAAMIKLIKKYRSELDTSFLISSHQDFEKAQLSIDNVYEVQSQTLKLIS